jgi:trans-aconitate methyltransferase
MGTEWNPELYQASHSFVWEYGRELLGLLAPRAGERILDVGCGTGQLTAEMASSGAQVTAIDNSPTMIAEARRNFPELRFELQNVLSMPYAGEFDAVFSNATLHWVREAGTAVAGIARALKPGGRFVAEFGGRGNVQSLLEAAFRALKSLGVPEPESLNPWYFPSVAEYAALLERHDLEVTYATLFDRLTPLEGGPKGLSDWLAMFGSQLAGALKDRQKDEFLRLVERHAAPALLRDGTWHADYRRLRVVARRTPWCSPAGAIRTSAR